VLGVRQSGMPEFRLADLGVHSAVLATAAEDARRIVETDPLLTGPWAALKYLPELYRERIRF
jgi:ATP-dependent DNA helicase RecG